MRRKEREVTDRKKIREIILSCSCCRVGFYDDGEIYIVPLDFGYSEDDEKGVFYFHGAKEGRKFDLIQKSDAVGFELDVNHKLIDGKTACQYTSQYQSVVGTGRMNLVEEEHSKIKALQSIMCHSTGRSDWDFSPRTREKVAVFQLQVEKLSCKEYLPTIKEDI